MTLGYSASHLLLGLLPARSQPGSTRPDSSCCHVVLQLKNKLAAAEAELDVLKASIAAARERDAFRIAYRHERSLDDGVAMLALRAQCWPRDMQDVLSRCGLAALHARPLPLSISPLSSICYFVWALSSCERVGCMSRAVLLHQLLPACSDSARVPLQHWLAPSY